MFKPSDFDASDMPKDATYIAARLANKIAEKWPVVYGRTDNWGYSEKEDVGIDTHKARLAFIEPIEKKECEHEGAQMVTDEGDFYFRCTKCWEKLKARWEVAE